MEPIIGWGLATLSALLIGYLAGYLKKKTENRAIHEDIDKLVEQMRAVTEATKEIEAKISSDVWDRQKRWEMKREVLFSAVTRIAEMDDALLSFANVFVQEQEPENLALSEARTKSRGKRCQVPFSQLEPHRGDLTKPRPTAWVNGTQTDT